MPHSDVTVTWEVDQGGHVTPQHFDIYLRDLTTNPPGPGSRPADRVHEHVTGRSARIPIGRLTPGHRYQVAMRVSDMEIWSEPVRFSIEPVTAATIRNRGVAVDIATAQNVADRINHHFFNNTDVEQRMRSGERMVFAFEGAGNYDGTIATNLTTTHPNAHPNGRYGAMLVVMRGMNILYITRRASTLPDNPTGTSGTSRSATVHNGVYNFHSQRHQGTYPTIQIRPLGSERYTPVPAVYAHPNFQGSTAVGINTHSADAPFSLTSNWSMGCIIMNFRDYPNFLDALDFITNQGQLNDARNAITRNAMRNQLSPAPRGNFTAINGVYVIDRTLMSATQRTAFALPAQDR